MINKRVIIVVANSCFFFFKVIWSFPHLYTYCLAARNCFKITVNGDEVKYLAAIRRGVSDHHTAKRNTRDVCEIETRLYLPYLYLYTCLISE